MERITLENTEFEGDNVAYLFDGDRTVLVDTGVSVDRVRDRLASSLATHEVAIGDLDTILVTHWHADHAGLVGELQAASGCSVRAHPADAGLVAKSATAEEELMTARTNQLDRWGVPDDARTALQSFFDAHADQNGESAEVTSIDEGETVPAGSETLTAIHTPGHTAGHLSYRRADGSILTGDALLGYYTPNVGGADPRVESPLATYLTTLQEFLTQSYSRAYPGHRIPIEDPAARAREIVGHHRERARRVLDVLSQREPADPWTVSDALFGDLAGIHILHGPGEAAAHLDHLDRAGLLERTTEGYVLLEDASPKLNAIFP